MCPHIPVYQRVQFPWADLKVFHDVMEGILCIVLCYCWYNRADAGMLVLRRDVTIDDFGILSTSRVKPLPATKPALYIMKNF